MKLSATLILTLVSFKLFAQINGVVIDSFTRQPVANANVKTAFLATSTSATGKFSLASVSFGDTLKITSIGYKPYYRVLGITNHDTLHIYLEQNFIGLKVVTIKGAPDYKIDSIKNRRAFADQFNYKPLALKDVFITKSPYTHVPYNNINTPNNTTAIVSINVLQLVSLLNKNKAPASRLQKILIKDEEESYVDHVFSKQKVSAITALKGDSLSDFMTQYRPSLMEAKKMNEYDMTLYIKQSYTEFIKNYKHEKYQPLK